MEVSVHDRVDVWNKLSRLAAAHELQQMCAAGGGGAGDKARRAGKKATHTPETRKAD